MSTTCGREPRPASLSIDATVPIGTLDFGLDGAPSAAANDAAITAQDVALTLPVLANDRPGVGALRLSGDGLDLDPATPETEAAVTIPGEGEFTAQPDGQVRFAPQPGFSGVSELTYRVRDDLGQWTHPARIRVTVAGPANPEGDSAGELPRANPDEGYTVLDTPLALAVLRNDVAGLGESLDPATLDLDPATPGLQAEQTTPEGQWQAQADGTVLYTPAPAYAGLARLAYAISDRQGQTATSTLVVEVGGGTVPLALDDSGATRPALPLALAVFDNDLAGTGLLAASLDLDPATPEVDTVLDRPEGQWQAQADGTVVYTPAPGFSGSALLNYAIADGSGQGTSAAIRIEVLPTLAPTALDDDATTPFDTPLTLAPAANDRAEPGAVLDPATLDLDPATLALETSLSTPEGDWQVQPDGRLSFTPGLHQVGAIPPLAYLIRDSLGQAASAQIRLTVAPPASIPLSGQVFHDLDHDQVRNGSEPGTDAGGLFVTALDAQGLAVATVPVGADGGYRLDLPPLADYHLLLSTLPDATVAQLPAGWSFTGNVPLPVRAGVLALDGLDFAIDGDPSVARDDRAATPHAVPVTLAPLANDQPGPGTNGFDPATLDLDPATPAIDTQFLLAGQGSYATQADGTVVFTPEPGFSGLSQAAYQVRDDLGQPANTATLTVAVGPDAVDDRLSTPAGAVYALDTAPGHGTATVNPDGGYGYRPAAGYDGPDIFTYRVCLAAPDESLCDSATLAVTVTAVTPTVDLRGTLEAGTRGRLLVLVDPPDEHCRRDDENEGDDDEHEDDDDDPQRQSRAQSQSDDDDDDQEDEDGEEEAGCLAQRAQRDYLEHVLQAGDWSYALVERAEDYTRALRGGAYGLHALLSAEVKLDETVQKELREAVNHGLGLLVGGDHDPRNHGLNEALGVKYLGHAKAAGLSVPPAPGYDGVHRNFAHPREVIRISPKTATVLGRFVDLHGKDQGPGLTRQAYGQGEAAYLGFDLLAEGAVLEPTGAGEFSQLLLNLLDDLAPLPAYRAGEVVGLRLLLHNAGPAVNGWADLALASGAAWYDAGGAEAQADGSLRWLYGLAPDQRLERRAWTRLPAAGTATVTARIHADGSRDDPYASLRLELPVAELPALDEALLRLDTLAESNRAYRSIRQSAQRAAAYLAQGKRDKARTELLKAADALLKIAGPDAADLRQAIDEALRRLGLAG